MNCVREIAVVASYQAGLTFFYYYLLHLLLSQTYQFGDILISLVIIAKVFFTINAGIYIIKQLVFI